MRRLLATAHRAHPHRRDPARNHRRGGSNHRRCRSETVDDYIGPEDGVWVEVIADRLRAWDYADAGYT